MSKQPWYAAGRSATAHPARAPGLCGRGRAVLAAPALLPAPWAAEGYIHPRRRTLPCQGTCWTPPKLRAPCSDQPSTILGALQDAKVRINKTLLAWLNSGTWIFNVFSEVPFCHWVLRLKKDEKVFLAEYNHVTFLCFISFFQMQCSWLGSVALQKWE